MSKQLDKIYNTNKIGRHPLWAFGILSGITGIGLAYSQQYTFAEIAIAVCCITFAIIFLTHTKIEGNIVQIASIKPKIEKNGKEIEEPNRQACEPTILPIEEYMSEKHNPHVLFTGASGTRKTTLMNFIIRKSKRVKIIFNFKKGDLYLKSGWRVVDVSKNPPDPFMDKGAYNSAFNTTYHIVPDRRGYMAIQTSLILNESLRQSNNFAEQTKYLEKEGRSDKSASGVLNQVKPLVIHGRILTGLDLTKDVVFDFSNFEFDEVKVFYAEIILNMIWNVLKNERRNILVAIDEAHHLISVPTTKINEFLKEGRSLGVAVYCATQGYSEIEGGIRSNFATKFIFKTDDPQTLDQLRKIPQTNLGEVAHFATGEFTDVGFPYLKAFVPIFYLALDEQDLENMEKQELEIENQEHNIIVTEVTPQVVVAPTTTGSSVVIQEKEESLREKILHVLDENKESMAISQVAKKFYKKGSTKSERDRVKLAVNNELDKLVDKDIIDKQTLVNEKRKKERHCFRKDDNLSKFHVRIQNGCIKLLKNNNITILNEATNRGKEGEDITLDKCVIECETGLKESLGLFNADVEKKILPVVIVVPNYEQRERYLELSSVKNGKAKVVLLVDLIQVVKELQK